jgi:hypothetical protein
MHDQPTPTEEEQNQADERLEEEEAMRGTGTESPEQPEEESEE